MTKRFIIFLVGSLALNLFLGGILIGNYLNISQNASSLPSTGRMFQQLITLLPKTTQTKVAPLIQKHIEAIKIQKYQVKLVRQSVYEHLSMPHFNPEKLSETLMRLRQERNKVQERMHTGLVEIATQLTFEERKQLAKFFEQRTQNLREEENMKKVR